MSGIVIPQSLRDFFQSRFWRILVTFNRFMALIGMILTVLIVAALLIMMSFFSS